MKWDLGLGRVSSGLGICEVGKDMGVSICRGPQLLYLAESVWRFP